MWLFLERRKRNKNVALIGLHGKRPNDDEWYCTVCVGTVRMPAHVSQKILKWKELTALLGQHSS